MQRGETDRRVTVKGSAHSVALGKALILSKIEGLTGIGMVGGYGWVSGQVRGWV
jgi:hypothetical protein